MNSKEYAEIMMLVRRYWQNFKPVPGTFETWERLLRDLPAPALAAAIDELAVSHPEFPPGPGLMRRRALELPGGGPPSADEALSEVYRQVSLVGYLGVPRWSHPAVEAAILALGGWQTLCRSEDMMADRAHFLKIYGAVEHRFRRAASLPPSVVSLMASVPAALGEGSPAVEP